MSPVKLLTRFDNDDGINPTLFMNFILYDTISVVSFPSVSIFTTSFFYYHGKGLILFTIFPNTLELAIKLICQLFDYKMKIISGISLNTLHFK